MSEEPEINPKLELLGALFRYDSCLEDIEEWVLHPYALDILRLKFDMLYMARVEHENGEIETKYLWLGIPITVDRTQKRNPTFNEIVEKAVKKTHGKVDSKYLS